MVALVQTHGCARYKYRAVEARNSLCKIGPDELPDFTCVAQRKHLSVKEKQHRQCYYPRFYTTQLIGRTSTSVCLRFGSKLLLSKISLLSESRCIVQRNMTMVTFFPFDSTVCQSQGQMWDTWPRGR